MALASSSIGNILDIQHDLFDSAFLACGTCVSALIITSQAGICPLFIAAGMGNAALVKTLLGHAAPIDQQNKVRISFSFMQSPDYFCISSQYPTLSLTIHV